MSEKLKTVFEKRRATVEEEKERKKEEVVESKVKEGAAIQNEIDFWT